MNKFDREAKDLYERVLFSETQGPQFYSEEQAREAAVHLRQAAVLIVSHLSSANAQIATIRRSLWLAVVLLVAIFIATA